MLGTNGMMGSGAEDITMFQWLRMSGASRRNPGRGRALGVNTVKFTGEVLKNVKKAIYEINMKKILKKEGATVGLANGILLADGKQIYTTENLKVGLFK